MVFVLMSVKEPPHVKPLPEPVNRRKTLFMAARGLMRHKDVGSLTQEVLWRLGSPPCQSVPCPARRTKLAADR